MLFAAVFIAVFVAVFVAVLVIILAVLVVVLAIARIIVFAAAIVHIFIMVFHGSIPPVSIINFCYRISMSNCERFIPFYLLFLFISIIIKLCEK